MKQQVYLNLKATFNRDYTLSRGWIGSRWDGTLPLKPNLVALITRLDPKTIEVDYDMEEVRLDSHTVDLGCFDLYDILCTVKFEPGYKDDSKPYIFKKIKGSKYKYKLSNGEELFYIGRNGNDSHLKDCFTLELVPTKGQKLKEIEL